MGDNHGYKYEQPEHEVCVDEFFIGRYEVTQKQWRALMGPNQARFVGDELPAQRISWNDAVEYIRRLNEKEKTNRYRLPTEAEWERAARAGTNTRYYWGDEIRNEYAWYYGSSKFTAHRVGTALPNAFGLYDMLGNVWEWVSDWYDSKYFKRSQKDNPKGPESGTMRTRRGGSMANLASYVRSASRYRSKPDKRHYIFGFRLAQSANVTD
ncbi:MAG: formylglycine-generating enzyme family protein [Candidatus Nitronauta litoralis]|uniref:Formylglycine-generating enzyme family protein n=1 Tax=Candidatus Nitronauta litoralis TaxID=2705533 RepID=A0A7T0BY41_9BACT|nr:MAG: formylglycine-generating enzyme family protein [Candidatus Nitronauta litoralis]